jgi:Coenzyme PQQ synthesis protein D (PqqD)
MMVRKRGDWLIATIGNQRVMMSTEKVRYIGINEVGARVWELIESPQEVDAVCAKLRTEYAISPEVCRAEVDAFLNELVENGAATLSPQPSAP